MNSADARTLDRAVSDGKVSEHDADEVRAFAELLSKLGRPGDPPTYESLIALAEFHERDADDPDWANLAHRYRHAAAHRLARQNARAPRG